MGLTEKLLTRKSKQTTNPLKEMARIFLCENHYLRRMEACTCSEPARDISQLSQPLVTQDSPMPQPSIRSDKPGEVNLYQGERNGYKLRTWLQEKDFRKDQLSHHFIYECLRMKPILLEPPDHSQSGKQIDRPQIFIFCPFPTKPISQSFPQPYSRLATAATHICPHL